jgi:hypothetical protein
LPGGCGSGPTVGQVGGEHLREGFPVDVQLNAQVAADVGEGGRAQGGHQLAAGEAAADVEDAFALVEGESGHIHQAHHVARGRSGGGDDRAAVGMTRQQYRTVDPARDAGDVGGVGRKPAQRVGQGDDAYSSGLQLGDDSRPHRPVGKPAMHEKHGRGAPVPGLGRAHHQLPDCGSGA